MTLNAKDMLKRTQVRSIPGISLKIISKDSSIEYIQLCRTLAQIMDFCNRLTLFLQRGVFIFKNELSDDIKINSNDAVEILRTKGNEFKIFVNFEGFIIGNCSESEFLNYQDNLIVDFDSPSILIYFDSEIIGNIKNVNKERYVHRWEKNARSIREFDQLMAWFEQEKVLHGTNLDFLWQNVTQLKLINRAEKRIQPILYEFFLDYILEPILIDREVKYPSGICDFKLNDKNGFILLIEVKIVGNFENYTYKYDKVESGLRQLNIYCGEESESNFGRLLVFDGESDRISFRREYNCPNDTKLIFIYMVKQFASSA